LLAVSWGSSVTSEAGRPVCTTIEPVTYLVALPIWARAPAAPASNTTYFLIHILGWIQDAQHACWKELCSVALHVSNTICISLLVQAPAVIASFPALIVEVEIEHGICEATFPCVNVPCNRDVKLS